MIRFPLFVFLCWFLFSFSLLANNKESRSSLLEEAQKHYLKGKEYYDKKEYLKADEEFKKAEELLKAYSSPKKVSLSSRPSLSSSSKEPPVPRKIMISKRTKEVMRLLKEADEASSAKKYEEAIKFYTEAAQLIPYNADIFFNLGVLYLKINSYWEAAQAFGRTEELNPKDAEALYNLGVLYEIFLNEPSTAVRYYRRYLELSPDAPDRQMIKAWISNLEGKDK